mgnify:CR=1 FL=1
MGIFKRRKKEAPPPDPLALLEGGLSSALVAAFPSLAFRPPLEPSNHDACRSWLAATPARCLALHAGNAIPCAQA